MRRLTAGLGRWLLIACAACAPRARERERHADVLPSRHIARWDAELTAVAAVLHTLEPGMARLEVGGTGPMSIRVISRATAGPGDVAAVEAGDTCSAHPSGIVCLDETIASILARPSPPVHPVLLFLIAHEVDHVRHGEIGRFSTPVMRIKPRATPEDIVGNLRDRACDQPNPAEVRADDFARGVIGRAVAAGLFSRGDGDVGLAAASVLMTMFEGIAQLPQGGDRSTAALLDNINAVSEDEITEVAQRVLCVIAPGQDHAVVWQGFPGTYQTEGVRLTRTAERLGDELTHGGYGMAANVGNFPELLRTMASAQLVMMRQNANLVTGVAARICKQFAERADPWHDLDCVPGTAADPAPPRGCPVLTAAAAKPPESSRAQPAAIAPVTAHGNELRARQPVTAVAVRRGGDVVLALGDRGHLVSWTDHAPPSVLGEAGCEVGGIAEDGAALVAVCRRGDAVVTLEGSRRRTTQLAPARVAGEDDLDHTQVSWAGTVAGRVVAAVHLVQSGRGMLTELTANGLRSVGAWTAPGCDAVGFAARVAEVDGALWATPASPAIEPQLIRLSGDLGGIVEHRRPDDARLERGGSNAADLDAPFMTCHMSGARHAPLCAAVDGRVVDARDPLGPVMARIPIGSLAAGPLEVRSCGTAHADYVMVIERGTRARVFALPAQGARGEIRWQTGLDAGGGERGDLVCGTGSAVFTLNRDDISTAVRLGAP